MVTLRNQVRAQVALGCRCVHGCIAFIRPNVDWKNSIFTFVSVTIMEDMPY